MLPPMRPILHRAALLTLLVLSACSGGSGPTPAPKPEPTPDPKPTTVPFTTVDTIAGQPGVGGSIDGPGAHATFNYPVAITRWVWLLPPRREGKTVRCCCISRARPMPTSDCLSRTATVRPSAACAEGLALLHPLRRRFRGLQQRTPG